MAIGDLYEVTLSGKMFNQTVENIFQYHQALEFVTTNPTKAQALAEGFNTQKLVQHKRICSNDVLFTQIKAQNLYDPSDTYTLGISVTGAGSLTSSDSQSSFDAFSFDLLTEDASVKQGAKRFPGVWEGAVEDGICTDSTYLTTVAPAVAAALTSPVTVGLIIPDNVFVPVVVKRVRSGSPGAYSYRMPTNSAEGVFSTIVVALFNILVKHQISRTIGIGI